MTATDRVLMNVTFQVTPSLLEKMRAYAREHNTTVTDWVGEVVKATLRGERTDSPVLFEGTALNLLHVILDDDGGERLTWAAGRRVRVVAIEDEAR